MTTAMERITRAATKRTPDVDFDFPRGRLRIKGEAYPEDAAAFFGPLLQALRVFLEPDDGPPISVDIEMVYFNSSSTKAFMNMFRLLEDAAVRGRSVTVNWICRPEDEAMVEFGEDFAQDFDHARFLVREPDTVGA